MRSSIFYLLSSIALSSLLTGCTRDFKFQSYSMWNESRLKPMEPSPMPNRLSSARELIPGTIPRGQLRAEEVVYSGRGTDGALTTRIPYPVNKAFLARGQERYNIYCAPCHSQTGDGNGMIVKRGFPIPPDYAIRRLREAPVGHFFDVMTNGYGVMYPYRNRVSVQDRWAIAAYIRVIQASRPEVPETRSPARRVIPPERVPDINQQGSPIEPNLPNTAPPAPGEGEPINPEISGSDVAPAPGGAAPAAPNATGGLATPPPDVPLTP